MYSIRLLYPGLTRKFDKELLKEIIENIKNKIPDIVIKSYKGELQDNFWTFKRPSNCVPANFDDADIVVIEKNKNIILETFVSGTGAPIGVVDIYEQYLSKSELDILFSIFKDKKFGKPQPASHDEYNRISLFLIFLGLVYIGIIIFNKDYFFSFPFWPTALIVIPPVILAIIALLIPSYFVKKERKKPR